jgi:hypothetical protein
LRSTLTPRASIRSRPGPQARRPFGRDRAAGFRAQLAAGGGWYGRKEFPLINSNKPHTPPYAAPYPASADSKNRIVWTNDFNSARPYRIDMDTGQLTEFMTPSNHEMRDRKVDESAERPTVWVAALLDQSVHATHHLNKGGFQLWNDVIVEMLARKKMTPV